MSGLQMKYFVLKPTGEDAYARASRMAMIAYARSIKEENKELYQELIDWVCNIHEKEETIVLSEDPERGDPNAG